MNKAAGYLADATDAAGLMAAYKDARVAVRHQANVEKGVIRSSAVLYDDPATAEKRLAEVEASIDKTLATRYDELRALYGVHAARLQAPALPPGPGWPAMTAAEQQASRTVVECVNASTRSGCANAPGAGRGGGGGRGAGGGAAGPSIPQHMNAELSILLGQKKSVLEIRDFLSGEFEPLPLDSLISVLKAREAAGSIKLVDRPAEPTKKK